MEAEKLFKEIKAIIFQNLMKSKSPQNQESQQTPSTRNRKKILP